MNDARERSLFEALRQWFASRGAETQPAGREVADEIHAALPESLSARGAIEEDRRRKAMIEQMLAESSR